MLTRLARLCKVLAVGIGLLMMSKTAAAACSYSQAPGWIEPFKFLFKLNVCQTSSNPVTSKVSFLAQYQVNGVPSQCKLIVNNSYECISSSDSILFDLITPGNANGFPSLTVSVNNEQCKLTTYCQNPNSNQGEQSKDDGMLSLGPFGTYPKPAAIIGLCIFSCLILGAIYLVYRRHRTYSRTISDEPTPRKTLWQLVCCSTHRNTGSRFSKSRNINIKTTTRNIEPQLKGNLEEGNIDTINNFSRLPLESVSINDLGSGVKNVPKSSVLVDLGDAVKKPLPTKSGANRSSVHLESNIKPKEKSLESPFYDTPTRSRTVKRNQTITDGSRDITPEEHSENIRNKIRGAVHNISDSFQSTTAQIGRSKTAKEHIKVRDQNRDAKKSETTKRNEKTHRLQVSKNDDIPLTRGRSKKTSRLNDSEGTTSKVHRSNTINSEKVDDKVSLSSKDNTPLGLIQRNRSLNLAKGNSVKEGSGSKHISTDDDDIPLLPAPGKTQTTPGNSDLQYESGTFPIVPKIIPTDSHYSDDIFDLYEDVRH